MKLSHIHFHTQFCQTQKSIRKLLERERKKIHKPENQCKEQDVINFVKANVLARSIGGQGQKENNLTTVEGFCHKKCSCAR